MTIRRYGTEIRYTDPIVSEGNLKIIAVPRPPDGIVKGTDHVSIFKKVYKPTARIGNRERWTTTTLWEDEINRDPTCQKLDLTWEPYKK